MVKCKFKGVTNKIIPILDKIAPMSYEVVTVEGNKVTVVVGSVEHPMTEAHLISWIVLETKKGWFRKHLNHTDKPVAIFTLEEGDEAVAAYEYCNLHGFWKTEIK